MSHLITDGVPTPVVSDFFRSNAGTALPAGTAADFTTPISHNGWLRLAGTQDPISPLQFGQLVRNDVIRMYENFPRSLHQFYGFGINESTLRFQVPFSGIPNSISTPPTPARFGFFGANSTAFDVETTTSAQFAQIRERFAEFGDPASAPSIVLESVGQTTTASIQLRNTGTQVAKIALAPGLFTFDTSGASIGTAATGGIWSKPGGGLWAATSDERTKKDIQPIVNHDRIFDLSPVTYQYNGLGGTSEGKTHTGLVAQAVRKVFPEWVSETAEAIDGEPVLQIDTSPLIFLLLEAVRDLKAEVKSLKERI